MRLTKKESYELELTERELKSLRELLEEFPSDEGHAFFDFSVDLLDTLERGE